MHLLFMLKMLNVLVVLSTRYLYLKLIFNNNFHKMFTTKHIVYLFILKLFCHLCFIYFYLIKYKISTSNIKIRNELVEQVKEFYYLGSLIMEDNRSAKEVGRRIVLAKQAFEKRDLY